MRSGSKSFQALLGTFQADLPTYLDNDNEPNTESPTPFETSAPFTSRNDAATIAIDVTTAPRTQANDEDTENISSVKNTVPAVKSISSSKASANDIIDHDSLNQELKEGFRLIEDIEQERDRLVSKLKQSVVGMQARFIKMKHENFLLTSELAAQHANAHLSENESKLIQIENERNTLEEANVLLRAELELVNSTHLQLETTMKANNATAQASIIEMETKLTHSERKRKNLEESDESLRYDLEKVNYKKQQLELALQDSITTSKASVLELENKLIQFENERTILVETNKSMQTKLDSLDSKKRQLEFTLDRTDELNCMLMNDLESATSDLEVSQNELLATKAECEALFSSKSTYSVLCKKLTRALNKKKKEEAEQKKEITRLRNEVSVLKERLKGKDNACVVG